MEWDILQDIKCVAADDAVILVDEYLNDDTRGYGIIYYSNEMSFKSKYL